MLWACPALSLVMGFARRSFSGGGSGYPLQVLAKNVLFRFAPLSFGEGPGVRLRAFRSYPSRGLHVRAYRFSLLSFGY
jgi:hypothetical protein